MPLTRQDNVPFSEMKGGSVHQGPRTAGNKSLLAYRSDRGIPGYTGYCPGWSTVPVPINGSTKHTGRLPDSTELDQATLKADQHASEYRSTYQASDPAAYQAPTKTTGGYYFGDRQRAAAGSSAPFSSSTTYEAEVLQGQQTAQQQRQQVEGLPSTLVSYQTARQQQHRGQPATTLSSTTAATSTGLVGYRTIYSATNRPLESRVQQAAAAATQRPASCPLAGGAERLRMAVMPTVTSCKRFDSSSSYSRDFGPLGSDPMRHATTLPGQQTLCSTTRELNQGTTRAMPQHPPGYTGFLPAADANTVAVEQAAGALPRPDAKQAMLPATLQQFSRGCVKGFTGYKPKGGPAASAVLPAHGPTADTTQGFVNRQVLERGPQPVDHRHCINNGLADAQRFFVGRRPYGGRMKHV